VDGDHGHDNVSGPSYRWTPGGGEASTPECFN
jgi:hypothetical protein